MSKKGRNHFFQPRNRIVRLMATEGRKRHNCERSPLPPILRQHPCGKITQAPKKRPQQHSQSPLHSSNWPYLTYFSSILWMDGKKKD